MPDTAPPATPAEAAFDIALRAAEPLVRDLSDRLVGHNALVVMVVAAACLRMHERALAEDGRLYVPRSLTLQHLSQIADRLTLAMAPVSVGN
jgi:hypothetical protein